MRLRDQEGWFVVVLNLLAGLVFGCLYWLEARQLEPSVFKVILCMCAPWYVQEALSPFSALRGWNWQGLKCALCCSPAFEGSAVITMLGYCSYGASSRLLLAPSVWTSAAWTSCRAAFLSGLHLSLTVPTSWGGRAYFVSPAGSLITRQAEEIVCLNQMGKNVVAWRVLLYGRNFFLNLMKGRDGVPLAWGLFPATPHKSLFQIT